MQLPEEAGKVELVRRYAQLLEQFGSELGQRPLVAQTAEYFPDAFTADQASVERLLARLQQHTGLADVPIGVQLEGQPAVASGACSSGGCGGPPIAGGGGRISETEEGWLLEVPQAELRHPTALSCNLSRALGRIFLEETRSDERPVPEPLEATTDLACVGLGLGLLLLEGAYIYSKSCGGPSVAQLTALSVGQLAVLCSLFAGSGGHSLRRARAPLGTTQRALLGEASEWYTSHEPVLAALRTNPAQLARADLELGETRSLLSRWFGRKKPEPTLEMALSGALDDHQLRALGERTRAAGGAKPSRAKDAELAALVDEALRSS